MPEPVPYVLNEPTGKRQIVLIPFDEEGTIRVEAYGNDLSKPVIVEEFSVPQFSD